MRISAPVHDEYLATLASRGGPESVGKVLTGAAASGIARGISEHQRAARAWFSCNGDVERAHTCGIYTRAAKVRGAAPVLGVYVDSSARLTDFRANRDVYLARLANAGLAVSDVEFRLSRTRKPGGVRAAGRTAPATEGRAVPRELGAEEARRVTELTADLPAGLRERASRAMILSLERGKTRDT